jgi:hypothetical protein
MNNIYDSITKKLHYERKKFKYQPSDNLVIILHAKIYHKLIQEILEMHPNFILKPNEKMESFQGARLIPNKNINQSEIIILPDFDSWLQSDIDILLKVISESFNENSK